MKHSIERTSAKGPGSAFVGTCVLCGMTGLMLADGLKDCENVRGLTDEEALLEAVRGPGVPHD